MEKIKEKFNPLVSIVIPVYNGANYMCEAIDSALAQTYENIEVIVVNDGSKDNTEEIAKSYGDKIRYFAKENGGVATALNLAIEKSKGEYISWLSHDDVYYLDKIEKQIRKLSALNGEKRFNTLLLSNYSLIDENSKFISNHKFHKTHDLDKLNYPLYPLLKGIVHGCTLLIPKHCFEDIAYFDSNLKTTQDYDLWFKMFPKYGMIFMPNLFVKSRWHAEQGSKKIKTANMEADELWIKMVNSLTDEQKIAIDDSVLSFYQKTHNIVNSAGYASAEKYLAEILEKYKLRDIAKIKVSVIIPFFNRINWTVEAIESVLRQTHTNLEVILVDDASTESLAPISDIISRDDRVTLIKNERKKGVSGARNTGIDNANGEFIAFLDSDDLFISNKLEKQLEFMVREGNLFSHTSYALFSSNNEKEEVIESGNRDLIYPEIIPNCSIATPTVMISADLLLDKNKRFIEKYSIGEDTCFWIRISKLFTCKGITGIYTKVRRHESNAAYNKQKQIEGLNNILEYVIENFLDEKTISYVNILNQNLISNNASGKQELIIRYFNKIYESDNLQIGDNDLIGNKFNGHDLHFYLNDKGINSRQLVWNNESGDENTFTIARGNLNRDEIYEYVKSIQKQYSLDGLLNPLGYDILLDPLFLRTEIVHLHLVHNHIFDIQLLPLMSRLKPIVWTLHDPWALGGHCIHHFECEKWKKLCGDCPNLKAHFELQLDNSALNFTLKKDAIKNSNLEIIVASEWMRDKVVQSPIFEGKKINVIPFGIDHEIFKSIEKNEARKKLGIREDALVFLLRCDYSGFKGMDIIEFVLTKIQSKKRVVLLVLKDKLRENLRNFEIKEYGWVKDDDLLAQIYSASDLFLMPSAMESFGMMAIEAMSCGTLPIVMDGTALSDTVNAPTCGVSTKRNKEEYVKTVQYYIDHEDERCDRAKKCLEFAKANYAKDVYVEKILKVYEEAKTKHELSKDDQFLLDQLMKSSIIVETKKGTTQLARNDKFLSIKFSLLKHYSTLLFLKYKYIVPKKIRINIRQQLEKISKY